MKLGECIVLCRADRKADGSKGNYELATCRVFPNEVDALVYCKGVSVSREPVIARIVFTRKLELED